MPVLFVYFSDRATLEKFWLDSIMGTSMSVLTVMHITPLIPWTKAAAALTIM